jgi:hypothetical protein
MIPSGNGNGVSNSRFYQLCRRLKYHTFSGVVCVLRQCFSRRESSFSARLARHTARCTHLHTHPLFNLRLTHAPVGHFRLARRRREPLLGHAAAAACHPSPQTLSMPLPLASGCVCAMCPLHARSQHSLLQADFGGGVLRRRGPCDLRRRFRNNECVFWRSAAASVLIRRHERRDASMCTERGKQADECRGKSKR